MTEVLRVEKGLHSFITEIGRFTKTFGFHYEVTLHPPCIKHHSGRWVVRPAPAWRDAFLVETREGQQLIITPDFFIVPSPEGYRYYEFIETPTSGGRRLHPLEVFASILEAVAKYVAALFLQRRRADGMPIEVDVVLSLESTR
jgi:hypothetical protein